MVGTWIKKMGDTVSPVAVVFLHGVLSDGEACWRHQNGTYWPELLSSHQTLADVGVYEFTYRTDIFSGSYNLSDVVNALKECLHLDGVNQARKIIFVAHSMGGIVARRYIVQRCDELVARGAQVGLFLIASPSLGSSYATWLEPIAKVMGHAQGQALTFCQSNVWLNDLNSDFRNLLALRKLVVHGRELVEDQFVAFKRWFRAEQVVPPFSSATYFGDALKVPQSDHFSIAKPEGAHALQHRTLCDFIEKIVRYIDSSNNVWECTGGYRTCVGGSEISIVLGRIEDYPAGRETAVVLPCNEYFEDHCATDSRTALGIYIQRHCAATSSVFFESVRQQCKTKFGAGTRKEKVDGEFSESYGPGLSIFVPDPSHNVAGIALVSTTTQTAGQGLAARMSYVFDGVGELFKLLADKRVNEVVMPVLGAGHGGIDPPLALAGLVLALAEGARYGVGRQSRKKITIVVFQKTPLEPPDVTLASIRKTLELVANKT